MRNFQLSSVLLSSVLLVGYGGGGGSNQYIGSSGSQPIISQPETNPPSQPEIVANLPFSSGSRDADMKSEFNLDAEVEDFVDKTLFRPLSDLEFVGDTTGHSILRRDNPASFLPYSNRILLPDDGEYGFNVKRTHNEPKVTVKLNADEYRAWLESLDINWFSITVRGQFNVLFSSLSWTKIMASAIHDGYYQWIRHLDYDPGQLDIGIADLGPRGKGAYFPSTNEIKIDSKWLSNIFYHYYQGVYNQIDPQQLDYLIGELTHLITHEAAHQFGYENPNGDSEGCGRGNKCHGPIGSGSVTSYDHHKGLSVNYGVTEEDVKHIPNATYNDNPYSGYKVSKDSPMGGYGVWIEHYFEVTGKTSPGTFLDGGHEIDNSISAYGFVDGRASWDDQLPFGTSYYITDTFVGADMSSLFLGTLLRADANLVYHPDSATSGNMILAINHLEILIGDDWENQNGSITYRLDCKANYCITNDGYTVKLWFGSNGQYVGGFIGDIKNEYVGAFVAKRN